mgnify:FL=1
MLITVNLNQIFMCVRRIVSSSLRWLRVRTSTFPILTIFAIAGNISFWWKKNYYLLQIPNILYVLLGSVLVLLKIVVLLGAIQSCWKSLLIHPSHPEYEERMEWVGESFNPDVFNIDEVNKMLKDLQ